MTDEDDLVKLPECPSLDAMLADLDAGVLALDVDGLFGTPEHRTAIDLSLGLPAPTKMVPSAPCARCGKALRRQRRRITTPLAKDPTRPRLCEPCRAEEKREHMRAHPGNVTDRDIAIERRRRANHMAKMEADPRLQAARVLMAKRMGLKPGESPDDFEIVAAGPRGVTFRKIPGR